MTGLLLGAQRFEHLQKMKRALIFTVRPDDGDCWYLPICCEFQPSCETENGPARG